MEFVEFGELVGGEERSIPSTALRTARSGASSDAERLGPTRSHLRMLTPQLDNKFSFPVSSQ
ncbi:MAG: hypothetical protein KDJ65_33015 [Anaerolineae bacterium]|nr:hypothetical protein [Anaerolineae bacterium]